MSDCSGGRNTRRIIGHIHHKERQEPSQTGSRDRKKKKLSPIEIIKYLPTTAVRLEIIIIVVILLYVIIVIVVVLYTARRDKAPGPSAGGIICDRGIAHNNCSLIIIIGVRYRDRDMG